MAGPGQNARSEQHSGKPVVPHKRGGLPEVTMESPIPHRFGLASSAPSAPVGCFPLSLNWCGVLQRAPARAPSDRADGTDGTANVQGTDGTQAADRRGTVFEC